MSKLRAGRRLDNRRLVLPSRRSGETIDDQSWRTKSGRPSSNDGTKLATPALQPPTPALADPSSKSPHLPLTPGRMGTDVAARPHQAPRPVTLTRRGAQRSMTTGTVTDQLRWQFLVAVCGAVLLLAGCAAGDDAVSQANTFQFVSPGGQVVIDYPEPERKPIADLSGEDLVTGDPVSLDDEEFAGKVVVLNVWGSWCGPCRAEAGALENVYQNNKDDGVAFLGINLRDNRQKAIDFVTDRGIEYPSLYDYPGASLVSLTTPTSVVPTTVILDREHRPATVYLRAVTEGELDNRVQAIAAEPEAA